MGLSRRQLLAGTAALAAAPLLSRLARAAGGAGRGRSLVVLFQRGAVDGLSMLVPLGEPELQRLRPRIAVPHPLPLDGRFGLHPRLAALQPLWRAGTLAGVHAVGLPRAQRSHFEAQELMESGIPDDLGSPDGWGNRALRAGGGDEDPFRAVAIGDSLPRALAGAAPTLAVDRPERFGVRAPARGRDFLEEGFAALYAGRDDAASVAGRRGLAAAARLRAVAEKDGGPANGAEYPRGPIGSGLRAAAQLLRGGLGTELLFIDAGGWDTHAAQGGEDGPLARRLATLGDAIAAFARDLGERLADVVLVTMSEFGRTVAENGTGGTDHGWGTAFLALGGPVRGGRVLGRWPGLAPEARFEGRDLAVTTDFRDVLAELLVGHLGTRATDAVFPRHTPQRVGLL
jgi:uncharacterized protein (DUF1501 family)